LYNDDEIFDEHDYDSEEEDDLIDEFNLDMLLNTNDTGTTPVDSSEEESTRMVQVQKKCVFINFIIIFFVSS
jgi:hypothetical protein